MPKLFRQLLILTGVLSALSLTLLAVVFLLGSRIDPNHISTYEENFALAPAELWPYVSDIPRQVDWNSGIVKVEALPPHEEGHQVWREIYHTGDSLDFYLSNIVEERQIHRTIYDAQSPFQGRWEIEIVPIEGDGSRLIVTEHGTISHPILRFIAHRLMGADIFVKGYVQNIKQAIESGSAD